MKRIVIFVLLFSLFSCDKDEPDTLSAKYSKEQIFNAVIGTWKFNRLAYDADFKKIKKVEGKECTANDRTILKKDGSITSIKGCYDKDNEDGNEITGNFSILFSGYIPGKNGTYIYIENSGMYLYPGTRFKGWMVLHSFTDSTLVISNVIFESDKGSEFDEYNLFSELKRVKE